MKKTILITGASSGIGEALAIEWSKQSNVCLILVARNRSALEKVSSQCVVNWAESHVVEMDLSNSASIEKAMIEINTRFSRIDIVVHNGGISQRSMVKDTDVNVYRRLMEVNFFGAVHLTKLLLPKMISCKSGQIVVVSSVMGKLGTPMRAGYAASKHALHGFFDCLRAEVCNDGIQVTIVCPGYVNTPISINALAADGSKFNEMNSTTANGMSSDVFARKMIAAVGARKSEICIAAPREALGVYLKRFFPNLLFKIVAKAKVV